MDGRMVRENKLYMTVDEMEGVRKCRGMVNGGKGTKKENADLRKPFGLLGLVPLLHNAHYTKKKPKVSSEITSRIL